MHLCIGTTPTVQHTLIFEHVELDQVNRAVRVLRSASGKSVNVARTLQALGHEVWLPLPVGGDTGDFMQRELRAAGMNVSPIAIASDARTCATVVDCAAKTATELVEEAPPLSDDNVRELLRLIEERVEDASTLVLSGSLAPGVAVDFYAKCCELAQSANVPVVLDARGEALRGALKFHPFAVKPNQRELETTFGRPMTSDGALRDAMAELKRQGPQWVVVTQGSRGAMAYDGARFLKVEPLEIEVASPIGSGDAFAGGLAAAISQKQDLAQACKLATACAAANAMVFGPGILHREDVQRLIGQVRVTALA